MSYNTTVELNKDNAFNMDIHISHVEFLGYDAIFFMVDPYTLDPIDEFVLEDFVPEDYNVFEHIRGGHETPNYTTETSEDYSVEDWWSELTDKDAKINEHVESQCLR